MKIFILSVGETIYSTQRLVDEAEDRGHGAHLVGCVALASENVFPLHRSCIVAAGEKKIL